jgi:hypothetical protein
MTSVETSRNRLAQPTGASLSRLRPPGVVTNRKVGQEVRTTVGDPLWQIRISLSAV